MITDSIRKRIEYEKRQLLKGKGAFKEAQKEIAKLIEEEAIARKYNALRPQPTEPVESKGKETWREVVAEGRKRVLDTLYVRYKRKIKREENQDSH